MGRARRGRLPVTALGCVLAAAMGATVAVASPVAAAAPTAVPGPVAQTADAPAPAAPTVADLVVTTRSVAVDWEPPAGVTVDSWTVQLAGPIPNRRTVRGDITSLTFTGLAPGTPHSLTITGYPAGTVSRLRVPLTTLAAVPAPRLGRIATSETGVRVEFYRPTVRATAVESLTFVDYVVVVGDRTEIVPDDPATNRYEVTVNDLPAGTTVPIRVTARVDRAADAESATASTRATLRTEAPPTARLTPRSGAIAVSVQRLQRAGSSRGATSAAGTLAPVTGYELTAGPTTVVTSSNGRTVLTGLAGNTAYPVSVVVLRGNLRSGPFALGEVTTLAAEAPAAPQNVRMMLPNARQPLFRWDPAPAGTVDRFEVYADDRLEATVEGTASSVGFRTSPLQPAPTSFRIVAINSIGSAETETVERVRSFGR